MSPSLPAKPSWRPDIEGLRGLAVLLVVCFHAGLPMLRGAFVAVDVFFVLSGFFLTRTLAKQLVAGDGIDLSDLYARRLWRLLPAMSFVLLATLVSALVLYAPIDRAAVAENLTPVAFFAGNLAFAADGVNYFSAGENPLLHTWTLGVEYQLVVLFPALVVALAWLGNKRAKHAPNADARRLIVMRTVLVGVAVAGVISFITSVAISRSAPMWAYFGPHTRLWAFAAGALMAFVAGEGQSLFGAQTQRIAVSQAIGLAAIFIPAMLFDRSMTYPGMIAIVPVAGTLLLLSGGALSSETIVGRALSTPVLTFFGRVSYPWYLWHWPLMVLGAVLVPDIGPWGRLACGFAGLLLAMLTQRFIETPVSDRVAPRLFASYPLVAAVSVSAVVMLLAQWSAARSTRFVNQSTHKVFATAREDRMDHGCWVRSVDVMHANQCEFFGDPSAKTTFALLGDSHAEHWLGGLDRAARENGWRVDAHVMGGCPVPDFSALTTGATARRYRECSRYREAMLTHIVDARPAAVILSSFDDYMQIDGSGRNEYQVSEKAWTEGLRLTYTRLSNAGIPVIVMRGTPRVPFDVPSCLSRLAAKLPFARDCTYTLNSNFIARARRAQDVAALGLNVRFVDMTDQVCPSTRCASVRRGIVVFTDDNHLTATFSKSVGLVLGQRVSDAWQSSRSAMQLAPKDCRNNIPGNYSRNSKLCPSLRSQFSGSQTVPSCWCMASGMPKRAITPS